MRQFLGEHAPWLVHDPKHTHTHTHTHSLSLTNTQTHAYIALLLSHFVRLPRSKCTWVKIPWWSICANMLKGTSTNLIVAALANAEGIPVGYVNSTLQCFRSVQSDALSDLHCCYSSLTQYPLLFMQFYRLFDISVIGVPVLICGLIYILIFSRILLPKNENPVDYIKNARKYTAAVEVKKVFVSHMLCTPLCVGGCFHHFCCCIKLHALLWSCCLRACVQTVWLNVLQNSIVVGKSIEEAGLRNLPGVYLFQINRKKEDGGHQVLAAPSSDTILVEGDILYFTGSSPWIILAILTWQRSGWHDERGL